MVRSKQYTNSVNRLSDRDMVFDLLITEKYMTQLYNNGILEAVDNKVRNLFEQFEHDEHENAKMLFHIMQQQGWYNVEKVGSDFAVKAGRRNDRNYAVTSGARRFGNRLSTRSQNLRSDYLKESKRSNFIHSDNKYNYEGYRNSPRSENYRLQ